MVAALVRRFCSSTMVAMSLAALAVVRSMSTMRSTPMPMPSGGMPNVASKLAIQLRRAADHETRQGQQDVQTDLDDHAADHRRHEKAGGDVVGAAVR